jgi:hypothetical protein
MGPHVVVTQAAHCSAMWTERQKHVHMHVAHSCLASHPLPNFILLASFHKKKY